MSENIENKNENANNTVSTEVKAEESKAITPVSKAEENELQQTNLLEMLEKLQKKQLFYQRLSCIFILILVIALISVLPSVFRTLHSAETVLKTAEVAMNNANEAITEARGTLADVSNLVVDSGKQIDDAMNQINDIDFAGLNKAIGDLQDVVEPMAKFFGKFR